MSPTLTKTIKPRQTDGALYRCPCCGSPTLETRGGDEICRLCIWQDLGQDDPYADEVWGGPNGRLSLTEARNNFRQCGAYDPRIGRGPVTSGRPAPEPPPTVRPHRRRVAPPPPPPADPPRPRPTAPAPSPPAAPPRPSWWAKLSKRQRITLAVEGVVLALAIFCVYLFVSGWLSGPMLGDRSYYLWAHEQAPYKPEHLVTFAHDPAFRSHFLGKPADSLHRFFPWLYWGSARYDPEALRAINPGHSFASYKGAQIQVYRLDSFQSGRVYSVLVVDGQIRDFFFVER